MASHSSAENLLLIAAREPIAGETKTRLGAAIGMERAATLYCAFLADLAERFTPGDSEPATYTLGWAFSPPTCDFRATLGTIHPGAFHPDVRFVPQDGPDWGMRQTNLLRWGRDRGFARTVLTASDSPQMTKRIIEEAFTKLQTHDVTLGRVYDGGYYLIGMRGFHEVLSGVAMSTASAADGLTARAGSLGLSITELTPTFDLDIADDLRHLRELADHDPTAAPASVRTLIELGLALPRS